MGGGSKKAPAEAAPAPEPKPQVTEAGPVAEGGRKPPGAARQERVGAKALLGSGTEQKSNGGLLG